MGFKREFSEINDIHPPVYKRVAALSLKNVRFCIYTGHTDRVFSVAYAPDGRTLASASADYSVRRWDVASGAALQVYTDHVAQVWSVAYAPDGLGLASAAANVGAGEGGEVALWDVADFVSSASRARPLSSPVNHWLARQAASVGRRAPGAVRQPLWVPHFPGADDRGCLGVLRGPNAGDGDLAPGAALSPDGQMLVVGHSSDYRLRCWDVRHGTLLWTSQEAHADTVCDVAWSPDGRWLASASSDHSVRIWEVASGTEQQHLNGYDHYVEAVAWSPDGRCLASASWDHSVWVWEVGNAAKRQRFNGHAEEVYGIAWSPDGRWLASASQDYSVRMWEVANGTEWQRLNGHTHAVNSVVWSPDGHLLASGSADNSVRVSEATSGHECKCFVFPVDEGEAWRLHWATSGAFLVSTHRGDTVRFWDTRDLVAPSVPLPEVAPHTQPLPAALVPLSATLAALQRLQCFPPLALVHDLLALLAGDTVPEALHPLASHPGLSRLRALRWPGPARVGLLALLLRQYRSDDWLPPPELTSSEVRRQLTAALSGEPMPAQAPPAPVALLTQAAEAIDDRLLTLLSALGSEAVAADPGLPLRLLPQVPQLPPLAAAQRRLLEMRLLPLEAGPAQGSGIGLDRTGIAPHGPLTALVPSQLAYPPTLFAWRYQTQSLLYRTRTGRELPHLRPTVLVLDVSPPCYGPVEGLTRLAAHLLARSLRRQGLATVLLAAGGPPRVYALEQPADLLLVFTVRTLQAVDLTATLRLAQRLCNTLQHDATEPVILLLTHPWWGADEPEVPGIPRLRALFVHYPGASVTPAWAGRCERWESLGPQQYDRLPTALGRLLG